MIVRFLGATNTVTGSKYLLSANDRSLLVDAGLFQGFKKLRLRNWSAPPFDPATLSAVVLTHAHIDHSGYLPVLMRNGFRGRVYATPATFELCKILLPDSGSLQEEQARFYHKHGRSKHKPALPIYRQDEAREQIETRAQHGERCERCDGVVHIRSLANSMDFGYIARDHDKIAIPAHIADGGNPQELSGFARSSPCSLVLAQKELLSD